MVMIMVVMNVYVTYRGRRYMVKALLTKRIWFNAISQSLFQRLFGSTWLRVKKPLVFYRGDEKIEVDKYADVTVEIGKLMIKAHLLIDDRLMGYTMEECDIIIGRETLEKNKIQVFE